MIIKNNTILIATKNKGKIEEFKNILKRLNIKIKTLYDYKMPEIEETGKTFYENALIKAKEGYNISKLITIADDSGLEVDALNGAPGIYSARFGSPDLNDEGRLEYLLNKLDGIKNRKAQFKTSLVLYNGENEIEEFQGVWKGEILKKPIGKNGFGYDSIFYDKTLQKSAAELTIEQKRVISHRGKAMRALINKFKEQL